MNILIVEDDEHKVVEIIKYLTEYGIPKSQCVIKESIVDTVHYLEKNTPDKIILDMSLSSHRVQATGSPPLSMTAGGIEVIMELRYQDKNYIPILILTQFSQVEINSKFFTLEDSGSELMRVFDMDNIAVNLFSNETNKERQEWQKSINLFLEEK
jgi:DNA-binding response OmpR family regulator